MQVYTVHKARVLVIGIIIGIIIILCIICILIQQSPEADFNNWSESTAPFSDDLVHSNEAKGTSQSVWKRFLRYRKVSYKSLFKSSLSAAFYNLIQRELIENGSLQATEDYGEYGENDIVADKLENNDYEQYYDENGNPETMLLKEDHINLRKVEQGSTTTIPTSTTQSNWLPDVTTLNSDLLNSTETANDRSFSQETAINHKLFVAPVILNWKARRQRKITMISQNGLPIVEDAIFWSQELEHLTPKGLTNQEISKFIQKMQDMKVVKVESATWNKCGRPRNQYITFEDGSHACARYREPHDYFVQAESMCFFLSRLLGIPNVPAVVLVRFGASKSWHDVTNQLLDAGWEDNATVAIIKWVDFLERNRMPPMVLNALSGHKSISWWTKELPILPLDQLIELLQWSDLIVFDYITGNYDRVASMQDAADKEKNPMILQDTIHNLVKSQSTKGLWLIDNESGLLDGYTLLYGLRPREDRFHVFHHSMLRTMCIFRWSTFQHVEYLHEHGHAEQLLLEFASEYEPHLHNISNDVRFQNFEKHFQERIDDVYKHMKRCMLFHTR